MGEIDKEYRIAEEIDKEYRIVEMRRENYKSVLNEARKYYLTCKGIGIIPEKGLQKVIYDLGKRVSINKGK